MGWGNHEGQWRGPTLPVLIDTRIEGNQRRDRFSDIQDLYTTQDWDAVWRVIDRYGIDYIVVGSAERTMIGDMAKNESDREATPEQKETRRQQLLRDYTLGLDKFAQVLTPACQFGQTTVYRVAPQ
jgi:hypothetical protein